MLQDSLNFPSVSAFVFVGFLSEQITAGKLVLENKIQFFFW